MMIRVLVALAEFRPSILCLRSLLLPPLKLLKLKGYELFKIQCDPLKMTNLLQSVAAR